MHWLRRLVRKEQAEKQLDAELRFHLEQQIAGYLAAGMQPAEARRRAHLEFGGVEQVKEEVRRSHRANSVETLIQDVRYGFRMLRKNRGFTFAAVVTLALGIGANTAIFSIVNAAILRPLPYKDSSRIFSVYTHSAMFPTFSLGLSWPAFQQIRSQALSLEQSAIYSNAEKTLTGKNDPALLLAASVSDGFFEELGATAALGRLLTEEDRKPGQDHVAVISDALWRNRFGSDASIVGRTLILDKQPYTVIGVASRDFSFPEKNDVWVPFLPTPQIEHQQAYFALSFLGKLRPGQKIGQLDAELATIAERMGKDNPELSAGFSFSAQSLLETRIQDSRTAYLVLLGASALVLLISCANLASLLLARGSSRQREMAVRAALGASPARLLRQGLAESCLIAFLGGGLGLLTAAGGVNLFRIVAPANSPRLDEISVDSTLLWFSLLTSFLAGILVGLAPARRASRMDPHEALKQGLGTSLGAASTTRQSRLGNTLVVVEVALAFILLIGSALMSQTVYNLLRQNPGFRTDHLLTFDLPSPPLWDDSDRKFIQQQSELLKQAIEQVQRLPGVASVTASNRGLLTGMSQMHSNLHVEGAIPARKGEQRAAKMRYVHPSFFRTLGIPLLRGREFSDRDTEDSAAVVIVNEAMAREYWGTLEVLGKRLSMSEDDKGKPVWNEVIGVASDAREVRLGSTPAPEYYLSMFQGGDSSIHLMARTFADPEALAGAVSRKIWSSHPDQPVTHITTLSRTISESVGDERLRSVLLVVFAGIGFALALVGVYGVISYSVARRVQEIGIRMALGAAPAAVLWMVLRQGLFPVVFGIVFGAAGAFGLTRVIASQLYGVEPGDPATFFGTAAVLLVVAALACSIPARRAAGVDPLVALRYE